MKNGYKSLSNAVYLGKRRKLKKYERHLHKSITHKRKIEFLFDKLNGFEDRLPTF